VQQTISANSKKRERELESRVKDQDQMINDQKKQITRYAELNKSLIDKIKDLEG
jgi:DNA-binding transcriptional regulator GbsR (MarR family)